MATAIEIKLIKFMIIYCNGVLLDRTTAGSYCSSYPSS